MHKKVLNMKNIRLHLTGIGETLTQEAEKKLEKENNYQIPKCDNGYTVEFYDDLGLDLPPELTKKLKNQDEGMKLEDEDFEPIYSDVSVYSDDILLMVSDEELTTIFLRDSNITLTVLETVDQINGYIDYINRPWYVKITDNIEYKWNIIFKKQIIEKQFNT